MLSLLEAALWAGGALVVLTWLGLLHATPAGYAASGLTVRKFAERWHFAWELSSRRSTAGATFLLFDLIDV